MVLDKMVPYTIRNAPGEYTCSYHGCLKKRQDEETLLVPTY